MDIFNIKLEFDHEALRQAIEQCVAEKGKGYVCVVDGTVLRMAQEDIDYREIVCNALMNTCDGSSLAMMCNRIYHTNYTAYPGPIIFKHYIEQHYKHLIIGNTEDAVEKVRATAKENGIDCQLYHLDVPFAKVEDFDYAGIAEKVNEISPDMIWVSLGAPKQERFMARLLPGINSGVMFGIGAAVNYYIGEIEAAKNPKMMWLKRIQTEPKKQLKRAWAYIKVLPSIYKEELKKSKKK